MRQKKSMIVENRDQYRGVFSFGSTGVLLAALTGCFCIDLVSLLQQFFAVAVLPAWKLGHDSIICGVSAVVRKGVRRNAGWIFET